MSTQQINNSPGLLERYRSLEQAEREFYQACALLFGRTIPRSDFPLYLRAVGITLENERPANQESVCKVIHKLEKAGLFGLDLTVKKGLRHQVILDALNSSKRFGYLQVYGILPRGEFLLNGRYYTRERDIETTLCLKLYMSVNSDEKAVSELLNAPCFGSVIYTHFCDIDPEWIKTLPLKIQLAIFEEKMQLLWAHNKMSPGLEETIACFSPLVGDPNHQAIARTFLGHALCTADLRFISDPARSAAILSALRDDLDLDVATLASIRFLQGDYASAKALFEKSIKLAKARLSSSKVFPNLIQGCYYVFTLLVHRDSQSLNTIINGANYVEKNGSIFISVFRHFRKLVFHLNNSSENIYRSMENTDNDGNLIVQAFTALVRYWMDQKTPANGLAAYHQAFESAQAWFPGIARILAEVLSKLSSKPAPYLDYLNRTRDLYPISFLQIVPIKKFWDHSLEMIERLYSVTEERSTKKAEALEGSRRLLWTINPEFPCITGVCEQKINAKGKWTKGRPIALERLKAGGTDFEYVTDQDRRAMSTIVSHTVRGYGYYSKIEHEFNHNKAFTALIGHPNVFNAITEAPVELIKGDISVVVRDKDDHFVLSLSAPCHAESVFLEEETDSRYLVLEATKEHVKLQQAIGAANALLIPKEAKKRLKAILDSMGSKIPVHSELHDESVRKEGDSTICAQLVPLQNGLKVTLCIRPFGAEGPHFRAGEGFTTPQTMIKGKLKKVRRNLALERQQANQLIETIESLKMSDEGQDEWLFEKPEEALSLLSEFRSYPHPLNLEWPNGKKLSVTPQVGTKALSIRVKADRDWFALEGELSVDDGQVIELKRLLELIDSDSSRFVSINDTHFLALTDHFKRQLRELKAISENQKGNLYIHPLTSSALNEMLGEVADFKSDAKWCEVRARLENAQAHRPVLPATLQAELRPYQEEGFQWLSRLAHWGVGACLADDMGLGKTIQALALILEHAEKGPTLVVAPTSVCHNWISECERFAPSLKVVLHAKERDPELLKALGPMQLLVTSYGLLYQENELLSSITWQTIILDEAQVIKNSQTKRSQAAHQLRGDVKVILTGTPVENRLSELWNLFRFINPGLLGSFESFSKRFAEPIEQNKDVAARQALKKIVLPFVLRRLKSQVMTELPPRIEKTVVIPFDSAEQAFYEALRQNAIEKLIQLNSQEKKRIHILAEITRLRRACCHPTLVAPEVNISGTKLRVVSELIDELRENRHRALLFSQFVGHLEKVKALLDEKKISYQYLDGSTPIDERQRRVAAYQSGQGDFFLISLRAGGTGLNLTGADYVIHLDPWWNPAVEDQASDRAHRIGQTRPVTIYRVIMEGTIEEKMLKLHQDKRDLVSDILDGADFSGKLSDEELLAMLAN